MFFLSLAVNAVNCPDGSVEVYERCFHFFNTLYTNYLDARQTCQAINGDLAIVDDCELHGALALHISSSGKQIFH